MGIWIERLRIDERILDKIQSKHNVQYHETIEVVESDYVIRRGREGTYLVYGQTAAGRYLLLVLIAETAGDWRVVTARDMTDTERRQFRRR